MESTSEGAMKNSESVCSELEGEGRSEESVDISQNILNVSDANSNDSRVVLRGKVFIRPSKLDETWNQLLKAKTARSKVPEGKEGGVLESEANRLEHFSRKRSGDNVHASSLEAPESSTSQKMMRVTSTLGKETPASGMRMRCPVILKQNSSCDDPDNTGLILLGNSSNQQSFADLRGKWDKGRNPISGKEETENVNNDDLWNDVDEFLKKEWQEYCHPLTARPPGDAKDEKPSEDFAHIETFGDAEPEKLEEINEFLVPYPTDNLSEYYMM